MVWILAGLHAASIGTMQQGNTGPGSNESEGADRRHAACFSRSVDHLPVNASPFIAARWAKAACAAPTFSVLPGPRLLRCRLRRPAIGEGQLPSHVTILSHRVGMHRRVHVRLSAGCGNTMPGTTAAAQTFRTRRVFSTTSSTLASLLPLLAQHHHPRLERVAFELDRARDRR